MTQEVKELLLKDLCARLPYGVALCAFYKTDEGWKEGNVCLLGMRADEGYIELHLDNGWIAYLDDVKPYLRPLSSMTDDELKEWTTLLNFVNENRLDKSIDWLNAHHFDYRGLIEKGLAISATKEIYGL
jgi:hypothetical protein